MASVPPSAANGTLIANASASAANVCVDTIRCIAPKCLIGPITTAAVRDVINEIC